MAPGGALTSFVWLGSLALLGSIAGSHAQPTPPLESQVKAAIVVNLPKYVEWPEAAFAASNTPIALRVFTSDALADALQKMAAQKTVGDRPLELQRGEPGGHAQSPPHILLLSGLEPKQADDLLKRCQGKPVLTVVDGDANTVPGGIVYLARKDNKVRLQVDLNAAKIAGLPISSKLLAVADTVKGRNQ